MPNPSLSKIKLNGVEYELEDTVARAATEQMADEIAGISGSVSSVNGKTGAVALDANDIGALPDDTPIPAAVTEQTVSNWGFTKNTGTYSKPSGGIPKSDLTSAVQTSLNKADTALQQHQSLTGYATETYVQQQIANIPNELPSSGSTGDFLCKTANGVAWQTIPSAESSSFGGGN